MELKIKKLRPDAVVPAYATAGSAGMDLYACLDEPMVLRPGQRVMVPTGLAIALPDPGWAAYLFARSGLAIKHGVTLPNCVGVIDSDYRGEVKVGLECHDEKGYTIQPGDRVAQLVIMPVVQAALSVVDELDDTARGTGGFGSTGK